MSAIVVTSFGLWWASFIALLFGRYDITEATTLVNIALAIGYLIYTMAVTWGFGLL